MTSTTAWLTPRSSRPTSSVVASLACFNCSHVRAATKMYRWGQMCTQTALTQTLTVEVFFRCDSKQGHLYCYQCKEIRRQKCRYEPNEKSSWLITSLSHRGCHPPCNFTIWEPITIFLCMQKLLVYINKYANLHLCYITIIGMVYHNVSPVVHAWRSANTIHQFQVNDHD